MSEKGYKFRIIGDDEFKIDPLERKLRDNRIDKEFIKQKIAQTEEDMNISDAERQFVLNGCNRLMEMLNEQEKNILKEMEEKKK